DEFVAMSGSEPGPEATNVVRKVMARYRVQTKPGIHIPDGVTARDALGDRLLALWRQRPDNLHEAMGATIEGAHRAIVRRGAVGCDGGESLTTGIYPSSPVGWV
ncbi:MAG: hypothetical protein ACO35E_07575, partial [Ilumatobacteraceae bacterium]